MKPSCKTCLYYEPIFEGKGDCRRHAPMLLDPIHGHTGWPMAKEDRWCGEWNDGEYAVVSLKRTADGGWKR